MIMVMRSLSKSGAGEQESERGDPSAHPPAGQSPEASMYICIYIYMYIHIYIYIEREREREIM